MKIPKLLHQYLSIQAPIVFMLFILSVSGSISLITHSFGVDSNGSLYLGKDSKIEVYRNSSLVFTITNLPRGFFFTINENDTILLSDGASTYVMDLNGIVLSQSEDPGGETQIKLLNRNTFKSKNGDVYLKRSNWGRVEIVQLTMNKETVIYTMPLLDYIMFVLAWLVGVSGLVLFPIIITNWKKKVNMKTIW